MNKSVDRDVVEKTSLYDAINNKRKSNYNRRKSGIYERFLNDVQHIGNKDPVTNSDTNVTEQPHLSNNDISSEAEQPATIIDKADLSLASTLKPNMSSTEPNSADVSHCEIADNISSELTINTSNLAKSIKLKTSLIIAVLFIVIAMTMISMWTMSSNRSSINKTTLANSQQTIVEPKIADNDVIVAVANDVLPAISDSIAEAAVPIKSLKKPLTTNDITLEPAANPNLDDNNDQSTVDVNSAISLEEFHEESLNTLYIEKVS